MANLEQTQTVPRPTFQMEARLLFPRGCRCTDHSCNFCVCAELGPDYVIGTSPLGEVA